MTFAIPCFTTLIAFMQPAGLQIYLLASVLLSGITATFLRSPGFRRQFNLHPLPSPESNELWKKVANGEIPLSKVMDNNGQLMPSKEIKAKYLAPNKAAEDPRRLLRDDIKLSGPIPAHLRPPPPPKLPEGLRDRDDDYDTPPPGVMKKLDWVARNYKPTYMYKRMRNFISQATGTKIAKSVEEVKKEAAKKKAEEYEYRRRQRFLNRR